MSSPLRPSGTTNGKWLIAGIRDRIGLAPQLLSGAEGASFSAVGLISGFYRPKGLVGDIGGGSLEVAEVLDDRVGERSVSLPLGTFPVKSMMDDGWAGARQRIDEMLKEHLPPLLTEPVFYLVVGGWRALAHVRIAKHSAPVKVTHGYEFDAMEARVLAKSVARSDPAEVAGLSGVPTRRVPTLPAAALELERELKTLNPERVVFSALGLREGWLYAQLSPEDQYRDPLIQSAQAFGTPLARLAKFGEASVSCRLGRINR